MSVASLERLQTSDEHYQPGPHDRAGPDVRERILLELAKRDTSDLPATRTAVTEAAALLLGVERASLWSIIGDKLVCDDLFVRDEARHTSGQVIRVESCPTYFAHIHKSAVIRAQNAHTDARTSELEDWYLRPLGIGAMLDTPIWMPGGVGGILCCEHVGPPRRWTNREERDARSMADIVARSIEASKRRTVEARWKVILEAIPQLVIVTNEAGTMMEANAAARSEIARLSGTFETGTTLAYRTANMEFRDMTGTIIPPSEWPDARARRGDSMRGEIIEFTHKPTGATRWLRTTSAPVTIGAHIRGAVVVYEDVAEEIRVERLKRDFLAAIAHELRTPTAIVRGYAQRLMKAPRRAEDQTHALAAMERASARIARLAEALVDLAAIRLGRIVLSMADVDLADIALQAIQGATGARAYRLRFLPPARTARVFVDPMRIQRVLVELIENAARYSSVGSEIDVELRIASGTAQVLVRDRGIGIPATAHGRIFEPFFRAHAGTPTDTGGLAIGLFLAREIVVRHGGTLTFESAEGWGSTFIVTLPLASSGGE